MWPSDVNIFGSWTQYDSLPRGTKFLLEYVSFFESTFIFDIFANQRFCCILRKLIFPIAKDCVFVFSAEADYCYFYADLRLKILCEYY